MIGEIGNFKMKKILLILLCLPLIGFGQVCIVFEKSFGGGLQGSNHDEGLSVKQTTDGGYIITGKTTSYGNGFPFGEFDVYLIKTDENGDSLWAETFGGTEHDEGRSVQQTTDGGYIMAGQTTVPLGSNGGYSSASYLIKTYPNGSLNWEYSFEGSGSNSVQQTADEGYIMAGSKYGNNGYHMSLIKTDSNGVEDWIHTYGTGGYDDAYSVKQTTDGGYIITGVKKQGSNDEDIYLIKTDMNGSEQWFQQFGGFYSDEGFSVEQTDDGGYIIAGYHTSSWGASKNIYVIKTHSNGSQDWAKEFGGANNDFGYCIQQTDDGGYIIAGDTESYGSGSRDGFLLKTNSYGDSLWQKNFGGTSFDRLRFVEQTTDGGYIITGTTMSFGNGYQVYVIKTDGNGNSTPILGCTDFLACNYDSTANTNNGSCDLPNGCGDPLYLEYSASVTCSDTSACITLIVNGCMDPTACNYIITANVDDGSCGGLLGCMDATACNYVVAATCDDGSCILPDGCLDPLYLEYDPSAQCDDGSCATLIVSGCTDPIACNYNVSFNVDDGSCILPDGCLDPLYLEYDPSAQCDDGSCATLIVNGCMDPTACLYDTLANVDDSSCYHIDVDIIPISNTLYFNDQSGSILDSYLWNTGDTNSNITPTLNGVYWLLVEDINQCIADTAYFTVNWILTDNTEISLVDLIIFPNPSEDIFNIVFTSKKTQNLHLRILNVLGKEIYNEYLDDFTGVYNKKIMLGKYLDAIYFFEIKSNEGLLHRRLIIQ